MDFYDIWSYYLLLEDDFEKTRKYLDLSLSNKSAYSDEFIKQYLTIGSELDVEFKKLCALLGKAKDGNIKKYAHTILGQYRHIHEVEIRVLRSDYRLKPFEKWDKNGNYWDANKPGTLLSWWNDYNGVKHNRGKFKKNANQKNVLDALSALYLLNMYIYKETLKERLPMIENGPSPSSKLFYLENQNTFMFNES